MGEITRDKKDELQRVWTGGVRGLVNWVAGQDARVGFVLDKVSGAKIAINISGTDEPAEEPFYIESPDGQNMYDAYDRKEAVKMLTNIRAGREADDDAPKKPRVSYSPKAKKSGKRRPGSATGIGGVR